MQKNDRKNGRRSSGLQEKKWKFWFIILNKLFLEKSLRGQVYTFDTGQVLT